MDLVKFFIFTISLCISCPLIGSQIAPENNNNLNNIGEIMKKISAGSEEFALDLFKRISVAVAPAAYDFMISPFTIWSLLVLVAEGAKGNTLEELRRTLRLNQDVTFVREGYKQIQKALTVNTTTVQVSAIQAIFSDANRPIDPQYERIIRDSYRADLVPVNFLDTLRAQTNINGFINKSTRGLIDYVVNEDDLFGVQLVLISAIFFKGQWKHPFNRSLTTQEPFYNEEGKPVGNVNMMFRKGMYLFTSIAALDSHVLEIPYGQENRLAMIILLPRKGAMLTSVIEKLASYGIAKIYTELNKSAPEDEDEEEVVEVYLPRFTSTSDFVLNIVLEQMGILDVFNADLADLSKMSSLPLFLSRVFHKTRIEVNEEGTVAAAVTAGIFRNKAQPDRFYINRPFAYIIVEKTTSSLLFCGQVRDPTKFNI